MAPSQIGRISPRHGGTDSSKSAPKPGFDAALSAELSKQQPLTLSAHAQRRLEQSNVRLTDSEKARLGRAVDQMSEKGANRSLVLMDALALVVSVKNRTVITAVDDARARHGAFTNIDSAIIA